MAGREPPKAPKTAVKTLGRTGLRPEAAAENAAAVAAAAGAGAGAGAAVEPRDEETRLEMLKAFSKNLVKYREMLQELGVESRRVAAEIDSEGVAMDVKMKKAQRQNEIMRAGMDRVSAAETPEEKKRIIGEIEAALKALDAESLGGRRRRGRGRGSKTTKRLRRNHRRHRKNTRHHR